VATLGLKNRFSLFFYFGIGVGSNPTDQARFAHECRLSDYNLCNLCNLCKGELHKNRVFGYIKNTAIPSRMSKMLCNVQRVLEMKGVVFDHHPLAQPLDDRNRKSASSSALC